MRWRGAAATGIDKFELVGLDACLMGHLEVMSALSEHARYAVSRRRLSRRWAGLRQLPAHVAGESRHRRRPAAVDRQQLHQR
jgi:hypothetical protein